MLTCKYLRAGVSYDIQYDRVAVDHAGLCDRNRCIACRKPLLRPVVRRGIGSRRWTTRRLETGDRPAESKKGNAIESRSRIQRLRSLVRLAEQADENNFADIWFESGPWTKRPDATGFGGHAVRPPGSEQTGHPQQMS